MRRRPCLPGGADQCGDEAGETGWGLAGDPERAGERQEDQSEEELGLAHDGLLVPEHHGICGEEEGGGDDEPAPCAEPEPDEAAGEEGAEKAEEMLADGDGDEGGDVEEEWKGEGDGDEEAALSIDEEGAALEEAEGGFEVFRGVVLDVAPRHPGGEDGAEEDAEGEGGKGVEEDLAEFRGGGDAAEGMGEEFGVCCHDPLDGGRRCAGEFQPRFSHKWRMTISPAGVFLSA